jgi:quercetin dioxygenase-like cupin family protein
MTAFRALSDLPIIAMSGGVAARAIEGREMTFAIVELAPGAAVKRHQHPQEQMGVLLRGAIRYTVGDESRDLRPGDTFIVPGGTSHEAVAGADGAVVIDVFSPVRADWETLERRAPTRATWP